MNTIRFPKEIFLSQVAAGKIYKFSDGQILNNSIAHYFVCVMVHSDCAYFVCCTKQFEKRKSFIAKNNHSQATLVPIKPGGGIHNDLTNTDSCIDCNNISKVMKERMWEQYTNVNFEHAGEVLESELQQILTGIHASKQHSPELKKYIPKDIDGLIS